MKFCGWVGMIQGWTQQRDTETNTQYTNGGDYWSYVLISTLHLPFDNQKNYNVSLCHKVSFQQKLSNIWLHSNLKYSNAQSQRRCLKLNNKYM